MNNNTDINFLLKEFSGGNKESAYKKLIKILHKRKNDDLLRYNVAVIEQELNLNEKARLNYKIIINKKQNIKAMVNLYNLEIKEEKYNDALRIINKVLELNNNLEFVAKDRAFVFLKLNKIDEAKSICNSLLRNNKENIDLLNVLGLCYLAEKEIDKAIDIFNQILNYDENNIAALNSLGRINHERRESVDAEKFFLKALKIDPSSYQVLNNIAGFYREEGNYKKSIDLYLRALELNPNNSYILNNLAKSYFDIDDFEKSEAYALRAHDLNKFDGNIKKILSFIYLRKQEYKKGWLYFDGRLNNSDFIEKNISFPELQTKILKLKKINNNSKLLVLREQGVGDEILYGTMYRDALDNLTNIKIECDKRLLNLFRNSFDKYKDKFVKIGEISSDKSKLDKFEKIIYAGSLGRLYRNNKKDFIKAPYLKAENYRVKNIENYLKQFNKKINIGISWKSFKNRYSNEKSLSLYNFEKILKNVNYNFINLQYGNVRSEIEEFSDNTGINLITNDKIDLFNDFDDLAALLKNLDLFLTVSNSTAHLAGALGVKTLLIKPSNHAMFHYWSQPSDKTPWYDSVILIDKNKLNDDDLIENNLFL